MKTDKIEDILFYTAIGLMSLLLIIMGYFWDKELKKKIVIKDPLFVMEDMSVVKPDTRGMYGVISEKDLKKFLNYKNTFQLMENNR